MNSSAAIHRGDDVDESADILEGSPREIRLFAVIINLNQKGGPVVEGDWRPRDLLDGRLNKLNAKRMSDVGCVPRKVCVCMGCVVGDGRTECASTGVESSMGAEYPRLF